MHINKMEWNIKLGDGQDKTTRSRHYFMRHEGRRILYVDFSNVTLADKEFGLACIAEAQQIISVQPPQSVLMITNVTNSSFDKEVTNMLRNFVEHNKRYVVRSAIVGLKGLQIPLLNALNKLTGRQMTSCNTVEEAKKWLVNDGN